MRNDLEISIKQLNENLTLINLPLISKYRVISFYGECDGLNDFVPLFNVNELIGRTIVIKSFRIDYYVRDLLYSDIELTDGVTITNEFLAIGVRINRVFERNTGMEIDFRINGAPTGIFGNNAGGISYPADLNLDNIFFKYPEKVQSISLRLNGLFARNPSSAVNDSIPFGKVTIECYLL